ncbi:MAG: YibE/F family protein [Chloroflexi bacterium]|nr:YibE/F family protein [Chloroflexota bacterium]
MLTEGARRTTLAALLGTFASLALVGILAAAFSALAQFTAIQGTEEIVFLQTLLGEGIDVSGLLLAAVIIGSLGVLDDVTISQAATVAELHRSDPGAGPAMLAGRAMNVGRSHIAATVNTLVLAYVGVALPLLVLFAVGGQSPTLLASQEVVAVEVMRALAGSVGIVLAVPLTTWITVAFVRADRRVAAGTEPGRG